MKKRIFNILLLIAVLLLADILVGFTGKKVIDKVSKAPLSSQAALIAYNVQSAKADVVMVGSSTATCHYIPSLLADSLSNFYGEKLTGFNAGTYIQGIQYCKAVIEGLFERCHPRMIIMDIQLQQLFEKMSESQQKPLRPYYRYNKNIKEILDENTDFIGKAELLSQMYCNNCELVKLITAMRFLGTSSEASGYDRQNGCMDGMPPLTTTMVNDGAEPMCVDDLLEIVEMCRANDCEFVAVISPFLNHEYSSSYYMDYLKEVCQENDVFLLDYLDDESFQDYKLFKDTRHMNHQGALKLSQRVYEDVRRSLLSASGNSGRE